MKPFIEGEIERLQRATTALNFMQRRLRALHEIDKNNVRLIQKTEQTIERDYAEYEAAREDILKAWDSEEKPEQKRFDMVTISEDHNWHPDRSF